MSSWGLLGYNLSVKRGQRISLYITSYSFSGNCASYSKKSSSFTYAF